MQEEIIISFASFYTGSFNSGIDTTRPYMYALGAVAFNAQTKLVVSTFDQTLQPPSSSENKRFDFILQSKKPEIQKILKNSQREVLPAKTVMNKFVGWLKDLNKHYNISIVVCDCPNDATWLDFYMTEYVDRDDDPQPLVSFGMKFTDWPYITHDIYRGILKTKNSWYLLDKLIDDKFKIPPSPDRWIKKYPEEHPLVYAFDIGYRFVHVWQLFD